MKRSTVVTMGAVGAGLIAAAVSPVACSLVLMAAQNALDARRNRRSLRLPSAALRTAPAPLSR